MFNTTQEAKDGPPSGDKQRKKQTQMKAAEQVKAIENKERPPSMRGGQDMFQIRQAICSHPVQNTAGNHCNHCLVPPVDSPSSPWWV